MSEELPGQPKFATVRTIVKSTTPDAASWGKTRAPLGEVVPLVRNGLGWTLPTSLPMWPRLGFGAVGRRGDGRLAS
jgi:hypothetical protein